MNIEIKNLYKKLDDFELKNISINVPKGKIVGLIGENGAGKTTLIKCILNIMNVNSGSILIFNNELNDTEKDDIGVVLDNSFVNGKYNAKDINLIMKNLYKNWDEMLYYDYLNKYNLPTNLELKKMSAGMKKKLEIATALSHHPKLLILDEPTSGLDPIIRSEILDMFQNFVENKENSILLSTHITTDLEHIADDILFISNGEIVFNSTLKDIQDNYHVITITKDEFNKINKNSYIKYKENKNDYQLLVNDKKIFKKYINGVSSLEDIMLLYIRGAK